MPDDDTTTPEAGREARAANLFDLRRIIGGLFLLYGAILTVVGLFDSHTEVARAAGVRMNLLAGIGMLVSAGSSSCGRCSGPSRSNSACTTTDAPHRRRARRVQSARARPRRLGAAARLPRACRERGDHVLPPDPAYGAAAGRRPPAPPPAGARAAATGPTVPAVLDRLAEGRAHPRGPRPLPRAVLRCRRDARELVSTPKAELAAVHPHARRLRARRRADRLAGARAVPAARSATRSTGARAGCPSRRSRR